MSLRPSADFYTPLLTYSHVAYLTANLEQAIAQLEASPAEPRFDRREVRLRVELGPAEMVGGECLLSVATSQGAGGSVELIQVVDELLPIFPLTQDLLSFHHTGGRVSDIEAAEAAALACGESWFRFDAGQAHIVFADARPTVGHWLESLCVP